MTQEFGEIGLADHQVAQGDSNAFVGLILCFFIAGAGTQFVDSRTASSTVPLDPTTGLIKQIPSYWVFNAMASHPITERISLQLNLYNLANRYYFDEPHPGHIVPGPAFTALVGLNFKF